MNLTSPRHALLFALCSTAAACGAGPTEGDALSESSAVGIVRPPRLPEQSFLSPVSWSRDFTSSTGWDPTIHVRALADVDGDGKQDIVGFGGAGVFLARSLGTSFEPIHLVLGSYGTEQSWTAAKHVRTIADINGDGRPDIVGFGDDGVSTSLGTGTGFTTDVGAIAQFGYNQGWRVEKHVRTMADVNGDGLADIVGFGDAGVWLSLANGSGFGPASFVLANFGANQGWDPALHVRTMGDVNGDGRQDIVAFGYDGVWTALSIGTSFAAPQLVLAAFGDSAAAGGWTAGGRHERRVVDIDNDHMADIVGFGENGTYVAHATGNGGFSAVTLAVADFGFTQMGYAALGESARFIGDFNGDGYQDIVGYTFSENIRRSLGGAGGTFYPSVNVMNVVTNIGGVIDAADVDHDGKPDLVGFAVSDVFVERSTASLPASPPFAPSGARITAITPTSMTLAWNDNSTDEVEFGLKYWNQATNVQSFATAPANTTTTTVTGLASAATYCFDVEAIGYFGTTAAPQVCGTTPLQGPALAVTSKTHTSLAFAITATAPGVSALRWTFDGTSSVGGTVQNGSSASPTFDGLQQATTHCVHAAQEVGSTWSADSLLCDTAPEVQNGSYQLVMLENAPPYTGTISYSGTWVPSGRTITGFASQSVLNHGIAFMKVGHDPTTECGTAASEILLLANGTLSASDVAQISWPQANGSTLFVACSVGTGTPTLLTTNILWTE